MTDLDAGSSQSQTDLKAGDMSSNPVLGDKAGVQVEGTQVGVVSAGPSVNTSSMHAGGDSKLSNHPERKVTLKSIEIPKTGFDAKHISAPSPMMSGVVRPLSTDPAKVRYLFYCNTTNLTYECAIFE